MVIILSLFWVLGHIKEKRSVPGPGPKPRLQVPCRGSEAACRQKGLALPKEQVGDDKAGKDDGRHPVHGGKGKVNA